MSPEQKITLRIKSLEQAITINQQRLNNNQVALDAPSVLKDSNLIYEFLIADTDVPEAIVKKLVN